MDKIINNTCEIVIDKSYEGIKNYIGNNGKISKYDKILTITDENVKEHQLYDFKRDTKLKNLCTFVIKAGEESKDMDVYTEIMEFCIKNGLMRKSLIIALGGGVVGDLAGFVASTYMRGIDVIQIPTTLLAQVDSSIGGKTGINIGNYKNVIGSFHQPRLTYINTNALKTLEENEFISAMSEVIKYGVIYDYEFLKYLNKYSEQIINREQEHIYEIVKRSATIKAEIVDKDEKEGGLRKILNFGHTFGHGVEKLMSINHGSAVSIGMNMAFKLALSENMIDKTYYDEFIEVCKKYSLMTEIPTKEENIENTILDIMKKDKKNSFDKISLILPTNKGEVVVTDNITNEKILKVIKETKHA